MAQILVWKSNLQREENRSTRRKTLGVRLRSTNLSPRAEPRTRSRVVEVGGATDDHYTNLTPQWDIIQDPTVILHVITETRLFFLSRHHLILTPTPLHCKTSEILFKIQLLFCMVPLKRDWLFWAPSPHPFYCKPSVRYYSWTSSDWFQWYSTNDAKFRSLENVWV